MADIKADASEMYVMANTLDDSLGTFKLCRRNIEEQIKIIGEIWSGKSKEKYTLKYGMISRQMDLFEQFAGEYIDLLEQAANDYITVDEESEEALGSLLEDFLDS